MFIGGSQTSTLTLSFVIYKRVSICAPIVQLSDHHVNHIYEQKVIVNMKH